MTWKPNDLYFILLLLQKEQLQRLEALHGEATSLLHAVTFLENTLGRSNCPSGYDQLSGLTKRLIDPHPQPNGNGTDRGGFAEVIRHALMNFDHFVALFGGTDDDLFAYRSMRDVPRIDIPDGGDGDANARFFRFQKFFYKNTQEFNQFLELFSRVRGRLSQDLELYPTQVHALPRYHNRESNTSRSYLQDVVAAYDDAICVLLRSLVADHGDEMEYLNTPLKISLTFEYNRSSTLRTERTKRGDRPTALLIESPHFYLHRPMYAPVLAHEVAHVYLNNLLFTHKGRDVLPAPLIRICDEMVTELQLLYADAGLLGFTPRVAEETITEVFADALALLVAGPSYLLGFLMSTAGLEQPFPGIDAVFNKFYRLQVLCDVCATFGGHERVKAPGPLVRDYLHPLYAITAAYDQLLRHPPGSVDPARLIRAANFYSTAANVLTTGFRRLLHMLEPEPNQNSGQYYFTSPQDEMPGAAMWFRELFRAASETLWEPGTEDRQLPRAPGECPCVTTEWPVLLRLLPEMLWEETLRWNDARFHDDTSRRQVFRFLPAEGRLFHYATNTLASQRIRATITPEQSDNPDRRCVVGEGDELLFPTSIVQLRHYRVATPAEPPESEVGSQTSPVVQALKEAEKARTAANSQGVDVVPMLAFGPVDLVIIKDWKGRLRTLDTLRENRDRGDAPRPVVPNNGGPGYYRNYNYGKLGLAADHDRADNATTPWRALLHLRLRRRVATEGHHRDALLDKPIVETMRQFNDARTEQHPNVSLVMGLLGQGYWDLVFVLSFSRVNDISRFSRAIPERILPGQVERTMLLFCIELGREDTSLDTIQEVLEGNTHPLLRSDGRELVEPALLVVGTQRSNGQLLADGDPPFRCMAVSGSTDGVFIIPSKSVFGPDGLADTPAAYRLISAINALVTKHRLLACETGFQLTGGGD